MRNAKHFITFAPLFLTLCFSASGFADENNSNDTNPYLTGEALISVFANTTMSGEYRVFRGETKTYRYTEYHNKNGTSDYIEGKRAEQGIWNILGDDKICYRYPNSKNFDQTYCFYVYSIEGCFYKFSQYDMTLKGPRHWDLWTSRCRAQRS